MASDSTVLSTSLVITTGIKRASLVLKKSYIKIVSESVDYIISTFYYLKQNAQPTGLKKIILKMFFLKDLTCPLHLIGFHFCKRMAVTVY